MPLQATSAKGTVNIGIESVSGEQSVMSPTPVAATMSSGITQAAIGSTGCKYIVVVKNWTAAGTFTVNGTVLVGSDSAVTVPAPSAQQTQGANYNFPYVTIANYSALTSITTTGLGNATIEVRAVQAPK